MTIMKKRIILGIDPGTRVTGYGIIEMGDREPCLLDFGCIRPSSALELPKKYLTIYQGIDHLLELYKVDVVAIENQYMSKNAQSALKLGMAKGVAMLAAAKRDIPVFEYAPKKAKLAVVGNGNASKQQVQKMIQLLLGLSSLPQPEDAADALALALCHSHHLTKVPLCLNT
ncbi:MAG: crossover junction endodeoxyribonuclease RuvC [Simkania negevensis]|nr:crossover junction endodeoxyribonuclease RuvC [Simkania negevensis]